jgi:hypothetical protein
LGGLAIFLVRLTFRGILTRVLHGGLEIRSQPRALLRMDVRHA